MIAWRTLSVMCREMLLKYADFDMWIFIARIGLNPCNACSIDNAPASRQNLLAGMPWERVGREQRERQHIRRPGRAHMRGVQLCELGVIREDEPDGGRRRSPGRCQSGRDRTGEDARGHGPVDPFAD